MAIRDWASKGGKARAAALTSEQRSDSARKAVNTRWGRRKIAGAACTQTGPIFMFRNYDTYTE